MITRRGAVSIHEGSPLFGMGAGAAAGVSAGLAASAAAAAGAATVAAASTGLAASSANAGAVKPHSIASSEKNTNSFFMMMFSLQRFCAGFASADADHGFEFMHKNLAVADLAGSCGFFDGFQRLIQQTGLYGGFQLYFRQEIHHIFRAAVQLGVAFLPAEALDLGDGDALHADGGKRLAHFVKLERFDDGGNHFHDNLLCKGGVNPAQ